MAQKIIKQPLYKIVLAFAAVYIIWGSAYVCNKMAVSEMPPFFLAGIRFVSAAVLIFIICLLTRQKTRVTAKKIMNATFAGFLFLTLGNGCLVYGLQYVDSSFAAILVAGEPLIVLLMLLVIRGQQIKLKSVIGVFLGILGIYLLVHQDEIIFASDSWKGFIGIAISMLAWGYASIFVGSADLPKNHFLNTAIQMLIGGVILLLISFLFETHTIPLSKVSNQVIIAMIYLIVFASIIAFTAFNYLLQYVSPEKVATSNYVNPIVAMILGWCMLNEKITSQSIIAAVILILGVYFVNSSKTSKQSK